MKHLQTYISKIIAYDPEAGTFHWRYMEDASTRGERIRNTRRAGKPAGFPHAQGIRIKIDGCIFSGHALAFLLMTGSIPRYIGHANGDLHDNRWANLVNRESRKSRWRKEAP